MTHLLPLHADTDLLALHRLAPQRYPLLLESTAAGRQGRWDMLLMAAGGQLRLDADGRVRREDGALVEGDFLAVLDREWQAQRLPRDASADVPFRGGWALLLDYELAAQVEPVLSLPMRGDGLPQALALRCPAAVLRDRGDGRCLAVLEDSGAALLEQLQRDLHDAAALPALPEWQPPTRIDEDDGARFTDGVARIIDYLRAGDVFQVNLSRRWQARFAQPLDPAALYARLRQANPAPFAGLFHAAGRAVVSSSPERLVSVCGEVVQTRPIAGTRPRFDGNEDDSASISELVGHPKERAEHVMLIDLERNDLGRIAAPGSVEVDELMTVESYAHVHHIVSNVRARLRPGVTPGQVIAATFPGGTITGCPKVRCMQIIAELEGQARGAYTGAFGWLNRDGDMDLNILIRTAEVRGDSASFRTGAGIVADSDPQKELDETRAKARGLLRAL